MTADTSRHARSVAVSVASQVVAKALHLALNVVSSLAIVRYLAPDSYGTFVLVLTVTTLVGVVADFGLPKLAVREMVRPDEDSDAVLGTLIALRLGLAFVAVGGIQVVLAAFRQGPEAHLAAAVASLVIVVEAVLGILVAIFHVHLVQQYEAVIRTVGEAVETALLLVLIAQGAPLPWLFAPPVAGVLAALVLAWSLARRRFGARPRVVTSRVRPLLLEALPLGPALIVGVVYLKLDSFVVGALRPSADLGLYGAAYQPIEYLFLATGVLINVLFPLLARAWSSGSPERFLALYRRGAELLVVLTGLVPALMLVVAGPLVELAFGSAYAGAASPLQVLAFALVFMTVNAWQSLVLLSGGHQRVTLIYNTVTLVPAVIGCVVLVHAIGMVGAAVAALVTSVFVFVVSTVAVRRTMGATLESRGLARMLAAIALAGLTVGGLATLGVPWWAAAVLALAPPTLLLGRLGFHRQLREAVA